MPEHTDGIAPDPASVDPASLHAAAMALRDADALLITAGAGMGVDSGLPDFRGNEGFWRAYPAFAKLGLRFSQLANPLWFDQDPELAWGFYGHRLHLYRDTIPHAGFHTLLRWARAKPAGYFVFTSNVDGQFQKAGFDPGRVVECHGSIHHGQCATLCSEEIWDLHERVEVNSETMRATPPLPACPYCGRLARPNVLMFGDDRWLPHRTDRQYGLYRDWVRGLVGRRVAVLEFGAGGAIPTVRSQSERVAAVLNGTLIRVNPREPGVPRGGIWLGLGAKEAIEHLVAVLEPR